jgi:hypothetical protein
MRWARLEPYVTHIYFEQFIIGCILDNPYFFELLLAYFLPRRKDRSGGGGPEAVRGRGSRSLQ